MPGTAVEGTTPLLVAVAVTAAACVREGHGQCPTRMAIDAYGTATRTFVARELADGSGEIGRHLAGGHDGPFERLPFEDRGRHGSDARREVKLFQNFVACFGTEAKGSARSAEAI